MERSAARRPVRPRCVLYCSATSSHDFPLDDLST
jgi:hypothetical protein